MAPKSSPKNTPIHPKKRELSRLASEEALASHNKEERKKERKSSEDKYVSLHLLDYGCLLINVYYWIDRIQIIPL